MAGNDFGIGVGKHPASFRAAMQSSLWLENFRWYETDAIPAEEIQDSYQLQQLKPQHIRILEVLVNSLQPAVRSKIVALASEDDNPSNDAALDVLINMASQPPCADAILSAVPKDVLEKVVVNLARILTTVSATDDTSALPAAKAISMLTASTSFCLELARKDGMRALIALSTTDELRFWNEISMANLCIPGGADVGQPTKDNAKAFFRKPGIVPFPSQEEYTALWNKVPVGLFPMTHDLDTFVEISRSVATVLKEGRSIDDITALPEESDMLLVRWCIDMYSIIAGDNKRSNSVGTEVIETQGHPYDNNEDYGGVVEIAGADYLAVKFDEIGRAHV